MVTPEMNGFERIRVLAGFDAFVDRIFHVVRKRNSYSHFDRMESMLEFSSLTQSASGHSANVERVLQNTKAGGNATLFALCAEKLGAQVQVLAPLGLPTMERVFAQASCSIAWQSLGQPGRTDALEFLDGKLMLNETGDVAKIGMDEILASVGESDWRHRIVQSDIVMLGNWTMNLGMKSVFEYFAKSDLDGFKGFLFLDIADPRKRFTEDLKEAIGQIRQMSKRMPVILGLNLSEATQVQNGLDIPGQLRDNGPELQQAAQRIFQDVGAGIVIHATRNAASCSADASAWVAGPYCANPIVTTGAGDHFNAGYSLACALKLPAQEALEWGVQCSGFYVREGRGPTFSELNQVIP